MPRGRGLGGSGMINYMIHGNPVLDDFKNWNIKHWEYEKIYPYFTNKCAQNNEDFCPLQIQVRKKELLWNLVHYLFYSSIVIFNRQTEVLNIFEIYKN